MGFGVPSCLHLSCFICHASFCSPAPSYCSPPPPPPPSSHAASYHPLPDCQRVSGWYSIHSDRGAKKSEFSFSVPEICAGSGAGSRSWTGKAEGECSACRLQPRRKTQEQMGFSLSCQSIVYCQVAVFACVNPGRDSVSGFYQTPMCTVSQSSTKRSREAL